MRKARKRLAVASNLWQANAMASMKKTMRALVLSMVLAAAWAQDAGAGEGISLEAGNGSFVASRMYRVAWITSWPWKWGKDVILTGYWDASIGWWERRDSLIGPPKGTADVGLTPVFRLQSAYSLSGVLPFLEGAVGLHLLSRPSAFGRRISTAFEFGDHVGIGLRVQERFEFSYRLQHYSNAGIARPNGGMNFHILRAVYLF